jgi:topoisomerase IA-like protein
MTTNKDLKATRTAAKITRGQLAGAAGISQFKLDRIDRGVDVGEDVPKAYDDGMARLLAESAKTQPTAKKQATAKPAAKKQAAKSTTSKPGTRARKAAQPKAKAEDPAA